MNHDLMLRDTRRKMFRGILKRVNIENDNLVDALVLASEDALEITMETESVLEELTPKPRMSLWEKMAKGMM